MKDANMTKAQLENELHMMQFSIDNALDRIAWIAPDGRFLYANKPACKEMHYSREEVLSKTLPEVDPNFSVKRWKEHFQELKKIGSMRLQTEQIDGKGKTHYLDVSSNYLKFGDKEFICSYGRDVTELKLVEQALVEQLGYERLIADIAANLAQAEPDQLEKVIDSVLQTLGMFLHTERAFLARFLENGKRLMHTNIWAAEGINLPRDLFKVNLAAEIPWLPQHILNNGLINAGHGLTGLPKEAKDLKNWLEKNGIKSVIIVPIRVEGPLDAPRIQPQIASLFADTEGASRTVSKIGEALRKKFKGRPVGEAIGRFLGNVQIGDAPRAAPQALAGPQEADPDQGDADEATDPKM